MAVIPPFRRLKKEDFGDQADWIEKLIQPLNTYMDSITSALNHGLTFSQNMAVQLKTITFTVPSDAVDGSAFSSPFPLKISLAALSGKPQGVWVWQITELGSDLPVGAVSLDWKTATVDSGPGISIRRINGVTADKKYSLTFLAVAG